MANVGTGKIIKITTLPFHLIIITCLLLFFINQLNKNFSVAAIKTVDDTTYTNWNEYNGDGNRSHYSTVGQVTKDNISKLKVAWEYSSGGGDVQGNRSQIQCNPIIINGILYGVSANTQVFALDAVNGRQLWRTNISDNGGTTSRGVTYFSDHIGKRIFFGAGKWLYALDAETGKAIITFGDSGRLDLKKGLERPGSDNYVVANTPNTIFKNLIITGVRVAESETAMLGDIRAFDVYTGKLVWTFRTIPAKGDLGYDSWSPNPRQSMGGANSWAGMAIDRPRGIVYIPTGSAAFDFYGGNRIGDNLFANCLLALDAATGKRLWHYQLVHHDIWDRDPPAPPNLITVTAQGRKIDAVAQVTKQGYVYVFNRVTGKPIFEIEEKAFSTKAIAGEHPSLTQPIPVKPAPFTRQTFIEKDFNSFVADRDSLVQILKQAHTGSIYLPVAKEMTIIYPGTDGGAQWGGAAADPDGMLYVPAKELPCYTSLKGVDNPADNASLTGVKLYNTYCSSCHGKDRTGTHDGSYPSLIGIEKRLSAAAVLNVLSKGKGMMSSYSHISLQQRKAITDFILNKKTTAKLEKGKTLQKKVPYQMTGYNRWYDKNGYPVNTPPWGTLTAINLNTGEHKWQVPLGEYKELIDKGIPATGTDNYGGPLVTASGLIFIAATRDEKFRAFEKQTGKLLWQTTLPAAGYASPSTYAINGKQYIVIACGGGKLKTKSGDKYVAFSLED
jgi:quinoprotein glucose dehydrogenase